MAFARPRKRPRLSVIGDDVHNKELAQARHQNDLILKNRFEAIFEKYSQDFSQIGDEVDLETGQIVVDNGHLASIRGEMDAGRASTASRSGSPTETHVTNGRSMLRAMTVAPDREDPYFRTDGANDVIYSIETIAENANYIDQDESDADDEDEENEESEDELFDTGTPLASHSSTTRKRPQSPASISQESIKNESEMESIFDQEPMYRGASPDELFDRSTPRSSLSQPTESGSSIGDDDLDKEADPDEEALLSRFGQSLGGEILEFLEERQNPQLHVEPAWRVPVNIDRPVRSFVSGHMTPAFTRGESSASETGSPNKGRSIWAADTRPGRRGLARARRRRQLAQTSGEDEDTDLDGLDEDTVSDQDDEEQEIRDDMSVDGGSRLLRKFQRFSRKQKNPKYAVKGPTNCPICDKEFSSYVGMIMHLAHIRTGIQDGKFNEDGHTLALLDPLFEDHRKDKEFYLVARRGECPYCDSTFKSYQGVLGHLSHVASRYRRGEFCDEQHHPDMLTRLQFIITPGAEDPPKHNIQQYVFRQKLEAALKKQAHGILESEPRTTCSQCSKSLAYSKPDHALWPFHAPKDGSTEEVLRMESHLPANIYVREHTDLPPIDAFGFGIDPDLPRLPLAPQSPMKDLATTGNSLMSIGDRLTEDDMLPFESSLLGDMFASTSSSMTPVDGAEFSSHRSQTPFEDTRQDDISSSKAKEQSHTRVRQTPSTNTRNATNRPHRTSATARSSVNNGASKSQPMYSSKNTRQPLRANSFPEEFLISDFRHTVELHEGGGLLFNGITPFLSEPWHCLSGRTLYYTYRQWRQYQQNGQRGALYPVEWSDEDNDLLMRMAEVNEGTMEGLKRYFSQKSAKAIGDRLALNWLPQVQKSEDAVRVAGDKVGRSQDWLDGNGSSRSEHEMVDAEFQLDGSGDADGDLGEHDEPNGPEQNGDSFTPAEETEDTEDELALPPSSGRKRAVSRPSARARTRATKRARLQQLADSDLES